ncbi:hypothetical protein HKD37_02G005181 [Glycine soja]
MKPIRRDHLFVTLRLVRSMSNLKQRLHTLGHRVLSFQPHCPINRTKISPLCNIILFNSFPLRMEAKSKSQAHFLYQLSGKCFALYHHLLSVKLILYSFDYLCIQDTCVRLPPKGTPFFQEDSLR